LPPATYALPPVCTLPTMKPPKVAVPVCGIWMALVSWPTT
jgi:hypothetical protein